MPIPYATVEYRRRARRMMLTAIDHNRNRRMTNPPHPDTGCTLACLAVVDTRDSAALQLAIDVGGLVRLPNGTYKPGWMRPA